MYDDVWSRLVHGHYKSHEAGLMGYVRLRVKGEEYPALVKAEGVCRVQGRVYLGVTHRDLERLDAFEGGQYRRESVSLEVNERLFNAYVYIWRSSLKCLLSRDQWSVKDFENRGLNQFLRRYRGF